MAVERPALGLHGGRGAADADWHAGNLHRSLLCFVVDDEESVRQTIARVVRKAGDEAQEFESVADLDSGLHRVRPDVIFLDIGLNRSDAVEAIRLLHEKKYRGLLQIVSGRAPDLLQSMQRVSARYGFEGLPPIRKPFRRGEIHSALSLARSLSPPARQGLVQPLSEPPRQPLPEVLLSTALERGWTEFHYQPKIDLRSGRLVGAESLLRVRHPEFGVIGPGNVLPKASAQSVDRLTEQALLAAMRDWAAFKGAGMNLRLAVNMPLSTLLRLPMGDLVRDARPKDDDWPGFLIEVTENEAIEDVALLDAVTTQLKIYHVELSIDDFGCGLSSLSRLRDLVFAELKLDRSFVEGCSSDAGKQAICQAAIDLARRFRAAFVAEGIEHRADLACLKGLGCEIGQGFLFGEALAVPDLIERHAREPIWTDLNDPAKVTAPLAPFATAAAESLTPRERDILACVVRGLSSKEIGRELGVSFRTVEVHRARALAKLGARNTAELLRLLLR